MVRGVQLLVLCTFVIYTLGTQKPIITQQQKEQMCSDMESSLFNPIRCIDDESELTLPGKMYKKAHPTISELDPVILLPGIGGSALDAILDKTDSPAWYCFKKWDWFRIWFAVDELLAQVCWMDNLAVTYNATSKVYNNTYGVGIRPTDFGGMKGIEYLDYIGDIPLTFTSIYATLVKSFVEVGYERGKNIRGAPFDWRLPAATLLENGYYDQFQALVEETYEINGGKPVHIVAHSLGCPTALYFLNRMPQSWKDTYVKSFAPIAGPWSGAAKALRAAVSGDNFGLAFAGIDILSKKAMRKIARQAGGLVQLFPDNILWDNDTVFVTTPTKNYTAHDYVQLFNDLDSPMTVIVFEDVNTLNELKAPNITTYCIYGTGVPTEISYHYEEGFDKDPVIDFTDLGDGTVPLASLGECIVWEKQQSQPLTVSKFQMITHGNIIKEPAVIEYLLTITTR